ncbi:MULTISPECIES: heat-inducible transcriptional repressor HrcA [Microbacterium]|jgi:heat-inducible transcriptional repressor|uniref:heat-inducible transcriptional repressor HrcA n=1 Tax=Microbacterium TaxID=33882 RepID=UPI000C6A3144|nr:MULTISPECIES: heat-inducible transcriptional repressor HrcA [Microbacterium]MEC8762075.1 heat-inducible transcriptional repressor HrcA [Actinomycetota bacterium]MBU20081.1 heat-inducible transcriptional repressor HrcA [Microbacterium sp.]MCC4268412.1 heat-inducible transcriptional repressor HrcA [Microbacterium schleiferi]RCL90869.1 MAG: heat-inducible transcriptional repressor HrcA [Microbacterium sp.]HBU42267.1 heat-inducible transcriptional repressor HrcA [Microbacterium sp.]|tara:strand:- start:5621 stop:6655 length:1035 start_codon:yes stop_codon:yes gene_type:complete
MVSERGLQVLRAIVQDYVDTREPVGSKAIVERHAFGVSAATIRNDMALLEDEELIAAPHTSSGRVPTDKGYRVFVDHLAEIRPLSPAQRAAIASFLQGPGDLDDALARTVRALTQLTGQVAIVQYPSFSKATITHVELVALEPSRVLVIVVTDTGRVSQRLALLTVALDETDLARVRAEVSTLLVGRSVRQGAKRVEEQADSDARTAHQSAVTEILRVVQEELDEFRQDRLVMAGAANLARRESDFRGSIYPLLEAIEEQVTILRLMGEMVADDNGLAASIGRENEAFGLSEASVIASDYDATGARARVGLMGPTRMDYPSNLAAVRAVARYLTGLLAEDEKGR